MARTSAHSASNATSNEVLKTSRAAHAARINVSQETHKAMHQHMIKSMVKISPAMRVPNNPFDSTGMLNVDEGVTLVDNRSKTLHTQSVLEIQNARFRPAFL